MKSFLIVLPALHEHKLISKWVPAILNPGQTSDSKQYKAPKKTNLTLVHKYRKGHFYCITYLYKNQTHKKQPTLDADRFLKNSYKYDLNLAQDVFSVKT